MGHIILAALCISSCVLTVTPLLNEEQVGRVTNYIERRFTKNFTYQYAYFVKFTADECNTGLSDQVIKEALEGENANDMYDKVNSFQIYNGPRMVVSSYIKDPHPEHSEYRLLNPGPHGSPISNLLSQEPSAGCVIFYSLNSPCINTCLSPSGPYNIITMLKNVPQLPVVKVFAFNQVFWYDKTSAQVQQAWGSLNAFMPLYRCNGNNCLQCFINGVLQKQCFP